MSSKKQIVILGAGYAGLMAALRLSGKTKEQNADLILVSGADTFVQRPRLHQAATGQAVPAERLKDMLRGTRVQLLLGWVTAVNPNIQTVSVQTSVGTREIGYDILVYALGSVVDQDSVPGVRDHAYVLDLQGANASSAVKQELQRLSGSSGQVVVVGSGPTGIEGATEIRGSFPDLNVELVTAGRFASFQGPRVEKHIREAFQEQNIRVYEGARVTAVEADQLVLSSGKSIPFDFCLWAGGFRALPLAREAGFTVNERGQILVDSCGRALSFPNVYAVGDASHPVEEPGVPMRMSLLTAVTRGAHAADNIAALLRNKEQRPLSFAYYGQGIALGPNDAVGFSAFPDDQAGRIILRGKPAVFVRSFFVWLIFYFLKLERRWPGLFMWIGKGRYAAQQTRKKQPQSQPIDQFGA